MTTTTTIKKLKIIIITNLVKMSSDIKNKGKEGLLEARKFRQNHKRNKNFLCSSSNKFYVMSSRLEQLKNSFSRFGVRLRKY